MSQLMADVVSKLQPSIFEIKELNGEGIKLEMESGESTQVDGSPIVVQNKNVITMEVRIFEKTVNTCDDHLLNEVVNSTLEKMDAHYRRLVVKNLRDNHEELDLSLVILSHYEQIVELLKLNSVPKSSTNLVAETNYATIKEKGFAVVDGKLTIKSVLINHINPVTTLTMSMLTLIRAADRDTCLNVVNYIETMIRSKKEFMS